MRPDDPAVVHDEHKISYLLALARDEHLFLLLRASRGSHFVLYLSGVRQSDTVPSYRHVPANPTHYLAVSMRFFRQ